MNWFFLKNCKKNLTLAKYFNSDVIDVTFNCNHSHRDQDQDRDQAREFNKRLAKQVAIIIIEGLQLQLLI